MPNNLLTAIISIAKFKNNDLNKYSSTYLNRINATGERLEFFIKDAISGSLKLKQDKKDAKHRKVFSYLGNQNNPPDMIVSKGDAFEIKKIENPFSSLALNSSPPKDRLYTSDPRLTGACRNCEPWKEKDLFYAIGCSRKGFLKYLFFVHGLCYAAEKSIYQNVHEPLKKEITSLLSSKNIEAGDTVELGKVRRVDPLGITELRIRGMWSIQNPIKAFSYVYRLDESKSFSLAALMTSKKYASFPANDIKALESNKSVKVEKVSVKSPNNPAIMLDSRLIRLV